LPPLSAAYGALALLAARGDDQCRRMLDASRSLFVRLAEAAPDLVTVVSARGGAVPRDQRSTGEASNGSSLIGLDEPQREGTRSGESRPERVP
jgi:hypothetical protein